MGIDNTSRLNNVELSHRVIFNSSKINVLVRSFNNGHVATDDASIRSTINKTSSLTSLPSLLVNGVSDLVRTPSLAFVRWVTILSVG